MEILAVLSFFVFGAVIGSFLNVVVLRHNTGGGLTGRSYCFTCGGEIKWHDLVPILSFICLGGRCRACRSRISVQYILVEAVTGLLFAAVFVKFWYFGAWPRLTNYLSLALDLSAMASLVVIGTYDLKHRIIPDRFAFLFGLIGLLVIFTTLPGVYYDWFGLLSYFLAGPIIALPFFLLWLLSRGRFIGLGDSKLMLGIGWFLGLLPAISAVVIGFWIGAAVSLFLLTVSWLIRRGNLSNSFLSPRLKRLTMGSEVPLGPFLILGFLLIYFFQFDVVGLSSLVAR